MDTASVVSLNRLLTKLDHSLLSAESDPHLRSSQYERNRVGANIEHARTLLLTLDKQSATVKTQSQRQQAQADLQRMRDLIKRLNGRIQELNDLDEDDDEDEEDDDEDEGEESGKSLLKEYAPARQNISSGLDTGEPQESRTDTTQANELRSRRPLQASDNRAEASTTAREQLFTGRPPSQSQSKQQDYEARQSHDRTEQEALTTGLLGLARALKDSSIQMGSSIESEKDILKRAEGGLDKSAQGMEAAEQKMGMLRRMSEGQGWYGRIKLYAFIFGLWIACFVLVFIGPKLRF
ncbi:hypothetical protein LTR08_001344 [Meristemomyces frigidus]|nr:hypothetical protein LTR08_001344 [Meristemomyces frigidus]